ncbi:OLC1v1006734C1 [Oldenlandia corymbosa var. corymbosa]|uniref:OLC1v1006734C1 n=1 Tax=Oldenlandia corymbosa var. corymbosa TaxID=529605 RepID=A0AAV1DHS5_OLDCO|nr:OLC1v1006734C1 [Oldenlandia corymbosa var. corymbosa]
MASEATGDNSVPEVITYPSSWDIWKSRIIVPSLLAGIAGGGVGLVSRHRKVHGLAKISATYATNFAIVTGCYCGAREFVRINRTGKPDDLLNSVIGGFGSGAILGRLQGGPVAAARYSILFAVVGTSVDYATIKLKPILSDYYKTMVGEGDKKQDWLKLPEWSPIQVLDEEALAAKREREEQLYRKVHNLNKEET